MKKRILSILLTLCMVLMLVPATAFAEGGISHDGWTELTKGILESNYKDNSYYSLPSGNYYLGEDISVDKTVRIGDGVNSVDVTLDLNGYTISMIGSVSEIKVRSGGNLTLHDSRPTATHTDVSLPAGGVITREDRLDGGGGGVSVDGGSFTMNGGTIYNCSARSGGGVSVGGGSFTMNGGAIYGCSAKVTGGGGVSVVDSIFTMNGGTIYDCLAEDFGDAVFSNIESNIYANGGTIKGTVVSFGKILNTATDGGCTRFYDEVTNATTSLSDHGTISGGIYYGGISGGGTVEGTYHTVSFDLNGGSGSIPKQWFVNIDTAQALEPAAPTREGYEFAAWYNGDTKYDFTQNVTEDITLTAKWENPEAPVITGLEDGKTYCDTVQFEVSDNVGVASITANGVTLTPDANNKYTLEKGTGTVTVVAIDKANNQTSVTVTVNNGHTGGTATCTQKAKCGICGEEYGELANHSLSKTDAKEATCTEDGNIEYWTCSVCHKLFSDENGTNETTFEAVTIKATDHTPGKWEYNSTQHWRFCTVCPAEIDRADHTFSGNTCTVCGYTRPSGGGVSTYAITLESAENGTVTMTPKTASKGTTVTLTVNPDKGYTLETLTVTDKNGNEIELTNKGDGKYTFTMPGSKVTVTATFMEDNSMLNFFVDVFPGDYYYDAVLWAAENDVTGGVDDTHFAPNATCTRAQIVTFLWRAAGSPEPENMSSFEDVSADAYYAKAVAWAVENGITTGTGDGKFSPNAPCTRAQSVTFLWRAQKSPASDSVNPFTDVAADAYYNSAVLWAAENGITGGTTATTFSPNNDCTRAQIVTFLYRCLGDE